MAVRNNDVDVVPVVNYFEESVCKLREVYSAQGCGENHEGCICDGSAQMLLACLKHGRALLTST